MYRRVYVFVGKCKSSVVRQLLAVRGPAKQLNNENFQNSDCMATLVFVLTEDERKRPEILWNLLRVTGDDLINYRTLLNN